mmetsp:Transcript_9622/g.18467  ORF Transcript_9622/g.18467 Transcript_9622/m.18467 type:complete len:268 (+) Transcript_9622:5-808(+)
MHAQVSQDKTGLVLAVCLFFYHITATAPLLHLCFLVESSRVDAGTRVFLRILLITAQLAAAPPTAAAWQAWRQAARVRAVRFYNVHAPHLRRGAKSRVMARVEARTPLTATQVDFRLQCHETYLHERRGRGGEMETSKRTRVLWERVYRVCSTPTDISPAQPEVFTHVLELPASIRPSSNGPPPYCTWFLACVLTVRPRGSRGEGARIVNEVSVNIASEAEAGMWVSGCDGVDDNTQAARGDSKDFNSSSNTTPRLSRRASSLLAAS